MSTPSSEEDALAEVYYLTKNTTKNWRKLLKYGDTLELKFKRNLLWIWPTEENIWQIDKLLRAAEIPNILSIGCGNGLFEWLIRESLTVPVYGLEANRSWWRSKYAIQNFIPLKYIEDLEQKSLNGTFLQECCSSKDWNFALMFCYFNNRSAFLEYLNVYQGKWIIIVGPLENMGIHTDPSPLEPKFPNASEYKWILWNSIDIGNSDIFVIYEKCLIKT